MPIQENPKRDAAHRPVVLLVDQETGGYSRSGAFTVDRGSVEGQVLPVLRQQLGTVVVLPFDPNAKATAAALRALQPSLVFNLTEWIDGERTRDHEITALLDRLQMRYTGTGGVGLKLCRDKAQVNRIAARLGMTVPRNFVIYPGQRVMASPLGYPVFIKPARGDGSDHINLQSCVRNSAELRERVRVLRQKKAGALLCEAYVPGSDVFVALLGNTPQVLQPLQLALGRQSPRAPRFATARLKHDVAYQKHWQVRYREAELPRSVITQLRRECKRLFHALHLRDYARFDFRLTPEGRLVFIEANPNPDLGRHTFGHERCFAGVPYVELIRRIAAAARQRSQKTLTFR